MELNPGIDVCGTSIQLFGENRKSKIINYPSQDALIKFNMLFFCSFAHPTILMKRSFCEKLNYQEGPLEDYRLWTSFINNADVKFANIGTVLLKLRKHASNLSGQTHVSEEIELKRNLLLELLKDKDEALCSQIGANDEIVSEFIQITGKVIKDQKQLESMRHRKDITLIFTHLIMIFSERTDIDKLYQ